MLVIAPLVPVHDYLARGWIVAFVFASMLAFAEIVRRG